jgi:hypothetical protein
MKQLKINHIAVWVSVVLLHVIGFFWYDPMLFGNQWMDMVDLTMEAAEAGSANAGLWITNLVSSAITVYALALLFTRLNVDTALKGFLVGSFIAFAFNFMPRMSGDMFAQMDYGLSWITGGFAMFGWGIAGLILGTWKKYV